MVEANRPAAGWPREGRVAFEAVCMRYRHGRARARVQRPDALKRTQTAHGWMDGRMRVRRRHARALVWTKWTRPHMSVVCGATLRV